MKNQYYSKGHDWHKDINENVRLERNRFFLFSLFLVCSLITLSIAFSFLFPLKETRPYLYENNTSTGEITPAREMKKGDFDAVKANILKHIADYLDYRENFNHKDIDENFKKVQLMSSDQVSQEYVQYMTKDKQSPYLRLTDEEHIKIYITTISFLKKDMSSALIHMETREYKTGSKKPIFKRWRIVMNYIWEGIPPDNEYIYFNPAGFKTTRFDKKQEISTEIDGL